MICPEGSECKADSCVKDEVQYPMMGANYWSTDDKPLDVFKCGSMERCPEGRSPGDCGPQLEGRACAHCIEGYEFDGKACVECGTKGAAGTFVFPILPIMLGPVAICALYKVSGDGYEKWGSWRVGLMSLVFIGMNHYQIINLLHGVNLVFPVKVDNVYKSFKVVDDVSSIFNPGCAGFADTQKLMIFKSIGPILVAVVFMLTWGGSQVVAQVSQMEKLRMEKNRTLNVFFSLIFTFFAGIVAMALMLFKCGDNPVGKSTLNADRSIICYEGDWNGMLVIGIFAVLFWCIGFGGVFTYTVVVAPKQFHDPAFQMRWKFLFIKFRPDVHWWALVFLMKGFMLNLGFVMIATGVGQVYWIMTILSLYSTCVMLIQPWRQLAINIADGAGHVCLMLSCSALSWFIRKDLSPDDILALDQDMMDLVISFSMLIIPVCIGVAGHLIYWKQVGRLPDEVKSVSDAMQRFAAEKPGDQTALLEALGDRDYFTMLQASQVVHTELAQFRCRFGVSTVKLSTTLPPPPETGKGGTADVMV
jgi:hypothetical protein